MSVPLSWCLEIQASAKSLVVKTALGKLARSPLNTQTVGVSDMSANVLPRSIVVGIVPDFVDRSTDCSEAPGTELQSSLIRPQAAFRCALGQDAGSATTVPEFIAGAHPDSTCVQLAVFSISGQSLSIVFTSSRQSSKVYST